MKGARIHGGKSVPVAWPDREVMWRVKAAATANMGWARSTTELPGVKQTHEDDNVSKFNVSPMPSSLQHFHNLYLILKGME